MWHHPYLSALRCSRAINLQTLKRPECFDPSRAAEKLCNPCRSTFNSLYWLPVCSLQITFKNATIKSPHTHNLPATLLPSSNIICQSEISVYPTHCFFLPTRQKQILVCMPFILLHQSSGTNYQYASKLHLLSHLSKPTSKLVIFSTHLDWSRDRAPQIRLRRFGLFALFMGVKTIRPHAGNNLFLSEFFNYRLDRMCSLTFAFLDMK